MRLHLVLASVVAVVLAACGSAATPPSGRTVTIEMREFGYSPQTLTLTPGERVTLTFKNVGTVEHEFMAGRDPMVGKGYGLDWLALAKVDSDAGHGSGGHTGVGLRVNPGKSGSLTLVVPQDKGEFEFGCFVAGHYEGGMKGKLVIE